MRGARGSALALLAVVPAASVEAALHVAGRDVYRTLADNDAYHALQAVGGLIRTGATGTNVNDVAVALVE